MKSAETVLKNLGLISIVIGILGGVLSIIISIIESEFFWFLIGLSCIFASYVSGYLLIGISNIIELLSSLNRTIKNQSYSSINQHDKLSKEVSLNNEEQNELKKNNPSSSNKKSFIENLEETPSKYASRNEAKNPAESKNRSWSEISDSMKKK
jgi:hypothetical protein